MLRQRQATVRCQSARFFFLSWDGDNFAQKCQIWTENIYSSISMASNSDLGHTMSRKTNQDLSRLQHFIRINWIIDFGSNPLSIFDIWFLELNENFALILFSSVLWCFRLVFVPFHFWIIFDPFFWLNIRSIFTVSNFVLIFNWSYFQSF